MKLYDEYGRLVVANQELNPSTELYISRLTSDTIEGDLYSFTHAVTYIRFKNGRLQHRNLTDGLWYYEICLSENGIPLLTISDEPGESDGAAPTGTFRIKNNRAQWKVSGLWYYWEGKLENGILLGTFTDEPGELV